MSIKEKFYRFKQKSAKRLGFIEDANISFDNRIAAFLFRAQRADYYYYLADILEGTKGRKSLLDIFKSDAERYGAAARGKLSKHWATQFDRGGGNLTKTFQSTLPDEDVAALESLQNIGSDSALESALRDLAENSELVSKARAIVFVSSIISLSCFALLLLFVMMLPIMIVPKLAETFSMLPAEYYPPSAVRFFSFSDFVGSNWFTITVAVTAFFIGCWYSLSNLTGPIRVFLDKYGLAWGIYRDFQSIRILSFLAAIIKRRGNTSTVLLEAVEMQTIGASRWKRHHIELMLQYIERGDIGPEMFTTGIMDKTMEWYIADLIEARGFEDALEFVRERLKDRVLKKITIQSTVISWVVILSSIMLAGLIMLWQTSVIEDMRKALTMFLQ